MQRGVQLRFAGAALLLAVWLPAPAAASSHMDAPLITMDDPANTTDVYAFVSKRGGEKYLTTALAVYPFEEPGIGPNAYDFDPAAVYDIHVAFGEDLAKGRPSITYRFRFDTVYKVDQTILQSYTGVVQKPNDPAQNRVQFYRAFRINRATGDETELRVAPAPEAGADRPLGFIGRGIVPPNNQGKVTPFYNTGDNGENRAKSGVARTGDLDVYTRKSLFDLSDGSRVFAGQRDDGFYADIQGVFDLLDFGGPNKPFDSQGGFNVHTIALEIPVSLMGTDQQVVGVYASVSRKKMRVLSDTSFPTYSGEFVQVARQGNPLFNEGFVAITDKDRYSRTDPVMDNDQFRKYAIKPELAKLINLVLNPTPAAPENNRTDIAGIFIPDLIKVDLSTDAARLAGNPDDPGFNRLGIFGGDVLKSSVQDPFGNGGFIPGGWPNGRRFGDDVVDIGVCALLSDLRPGPGFRVACDGSANIDRVTHNDITYNKVLPYAATPLNGRNHEHHD